MKKDASLAIARSGDSLVWARLARTTPEPQRAGTGSGVPSLRSSDAVTLVLPTADTIFRRLDVPSDDPDEIADIAAAQMEQESPLDPAEMVFSHEILQTREGHASVLAVAAAAAAVEALRDAAGVDPGRVARVDAAALGLARALQGYPAVAATGLQPVLAEEDGNLILLLLEGGLLVMARVLAPLAAAQASGVATAVRLAMLQSAARDDDGRGSAPEPETPAPVLVLSGAPALKALGEAAAERLGRACTALSPTELPSAAAGAASRTLEDVTLNLFPEAWVTKLADRSYRRRFLLGSLGAFLVWLLLVAGLYAWPLLLSARETVLRAEVQRLEPEEHAVNEIRERIRMIDRYSDRSFSPLEVLREVSLSLPEGVTLTAYRYDAVRREATVEASTPNGTLPAYEFSNRLKASNLFASDTFVSGPTESKSGERTTFTLRLAFAEEAKGGAQ